MDRIALITGLTYLQIAVTYSLLLVDIPATWNNTNKTISLKTAISYYKHRKEAIPYKVFVPIACVLLTGGVLLNAWYQRDLYSIIMIAVAFLTAMNNGKNVVDPATAIGDNKEKELDTLSTITLGHFIDFVGFTILWILVYNRHGQKLVNKLE